MKELINLIKEQILHVHLIRKLAIYNIKSKYSNHYLGVFWNILQPLMQVGLYYVVFGLGLRGVRHDVIGVPFIIHLISGLFPWMFISQSIIGGSLAIYQRLGLVTKMKFPSSVLLSISFTNTLINLLITTSILFLLSLYYQLVPIWHYFWFFYFIIASYALIFGISLIMSTLVIIVRDTNNILQNVMRMAFFVTPIFWAIENATPLMVKINAFNPFGYLVGTYRVAFIRDHVSVYGSWHDHLFYWTICLLLLFIGSQVHYKFRNKLVDYL